jgi:sugar lactone lactonase YvrE
MSLSGFAAAQTGRVFPWQYFWQQSLAAAKKKDHAAFLENAGKAVESGPTNHPTLFYNLARAYSLTGNEGRAAEWLEKTLNLGFGAEALAGEDFTFLRGAPRYDRLRQRIARINAPLVKSAVARTIYEPDLIPESVAYDRRNGDLYVGSLHKRKIVRVDRRGRATDFAPEGKDDLAAVFGIKIDDKRRCLWALNNFAPDMKNFDAAREGTGKLYRYDLASGRLQQTYELPNKPRPHLLNDLAIARNGDLYITDSLSSVVHVLRNGGGELEIFASLTPYSYPNGLALSADESRLYVANLNGIAVVDLKTGKTAPLAAAETIALAGVDGLYFYRNSLLAIQNFEQPNRVARFHLNETGDRVERAEILESNHPLYQTPTTGALVGADFYYVANSQLRSYDETGKLPPLEKLRSVAILKLKL